MKRCEIALKNGKYKFTFALSSIIIDTCDDMKKVSSFLAIRGEALHRCGAIRDATEHYLAHLYLLSQQNLTASRSLPLTFLRLASVYPGFSVAAGRRMSTITIDKIMNSTMHILSPNRGLCQMIIYDPERLNTFLSNFDIGIKIIDKKYSPIFAEFILYSMTPFLGNASLTNASNVCSVWNTFFKAKLKINNKMNEVNNIVNRIEIAVSQMSILEYVKKELNNITSISSWKENEEYVKDFPLSQCYLGPENEDLIKTKHFPPILQYVMNKHSFYKLPENLQDSEVIYELCQQIKGKENHQHFLGNDSYFPQLEHITVPVADKVKQHLADIDRKVDADINCYRNCSYVYDGIHNLIQIMHEYHCCSG
jgi:hypothetical protein